MSKLDNLCLPANFFVEDSDGWPIIDLRAIATQLEITITADNLEIIAKVVERVILHAPDCTSFRLTAHSLRILHERHLGRPTSVGNNEHQNPV